VVRSSIKGWWLLAVCAAFYAMFSATILSLRSLDGFLRAWIGTRDTIVLLGALALAAGACTIAVGVSGLRKRSSWLLALNGLACGALGLMVTLGATRPVTFRSIAIVIVVMAVSIGLYELRSARAFRGRLAGEWLLGVAGAVSMGFAVAFLGFVLHWIKLDPSPSGQTFYWLSSYFGFSAICMLGLAVSSFRTLPDAHRPA
jgi:hypothetical protein